MPMGLSSLGASPNSVPDQGNTPQGLSSIAGNVTNQLSNPGMGGGRYGAGLSGMVSPQQRQQFGSLMAGGSSQQNNPYAQMIAQRISNLTNQYGPIPGGQGGQPPQGMTPPQPQMGPGMMPPGMGGGMPGMMPQGMPGMGAMPGAPMPGMMPMPQPMMPPGMMAPQGGMGVAPSGIPPMGPVAPSGAAMMGAQGMPPSIAGFAR